MAASFSSEPHDNVALFDLDGTLVDYDNSMRKALLSIASPNDGPLPDDIHTDDIPWLKRRRELIRSQPGFWQHLPCLKLGWDVLDIAEVLGFECHVLTKGPVKASNAWTEKLLWCQNNIGNIPVTIGMKKSLVYGRVLVDDYPDYFLPWLKVRPRGLVICPAQKWNADVKHPQVVRYDGTNLDEVKERLAEARARTRV